MYTAFWGLATSILKCHTLKEGRFYHLNMESNEKKEDKSTFPCNFYLFTCMVELSHFLSTCILGCTKMKLYYMYYPHGVILTPGKKN